MKITSVNVNGIRAAARKGFFDWLAGEQPDVLCLQEIKAKPEQLMDATFRPEGYFPFFHSAEKPGYSGVALYAKREPDAVQTGIGWADVDAEGRYLEARFGDLSVISLYMQSGSSSEARQAVKYDFMDRFYEHLRELSTNGREYIICGDWNIAHKEIDLKNWKSNQKNSGFLPEERAWLTRVFDELGFVDAFRVVNQEAEQYTWWSNRGQAWAKNVGWRIDYHVVTQALKERIRSAAIYTDERFSDHAPLTLEYDYPF
ncbi:exodeoxyribonuclease III [Alkalilimnicola ehrlichii]|uniref:exodeoxyribonuclease III n=1 Tax=Alkalilimnicola ehrlichii TaxID=351052 RepID=UPI000E2E5E77|nr:exodeoxyribonuclease III [Alkalilimnicola ehrlichii]RFA30042.1 exodeoxyribonuclease III [Alkalilimnicola ehrlichii]